MVLQCTSTVLQGLNGSSEKEDVKKCSGDGYQYCVYSLLYLEIDTSTYCILR
jgi:hypothetical protein